MFLQQLAYPPVILLASLMLITACSEQEASSPDPSEPSNAAQLTQTPPNSTAGLAYVSNQNGQISVIDLNDFQVLRQIDPGSGEPRGIGISDDGKWLVTANRAAGNLSLIDRATGELMSQVEIGENPEFVRVRGQLAFVSFEPESIAGPPPKPGSPEALALAKQREEEETEPAQIAVVDLDANKVVRTIVGGIETEGIEFSHDGEHILITNEAENTVTVHHIESGERIASIDTAPHGPRPRGIRQRPDGKGYVASLEYGNKLMLIDQQYQFERTVDTGKVPYGLAYSPDGKTLVVALAHGNALQLFDADSMIETARIPTGKRCWHFSYTPDGAHLLVVCGRSNEVVVIDTKTNQEVTRIKDQKLPWGIVTWPKSVGSLDVSRN